MLVLHVCVGQLRTVVLGKGRWTADAYAASMLWLPLYWILSPLSGTLQIG